MYAKLLSIMLRITLGCSYSFPLGIEMVWSTPASVVRGTSQSAGGSTIGSRSAARDGVINLFEMLLMPYF